MTVRYWLFRLWQEFKGEILVLPGRTIMFAVLRILTMTCIFAIFAASWDLLSGFVGQLNLGHAIFFGVAAYVSGLLNLHLGLPPLVTIPLGALGAVLTGLVVGVPCLRLKGQYLSLATLAFPIILMGLVFMFTDVTGGELGVSGLDRLAPSRLHEYYVAAVTAIVLLLVMWKVTDSKLGIIFHAIREDEIAARASGINTPLYKLLRRALRPLHAAGRTLHPQHAHVLPGHHLDYLRRHRHHPRARGGCVRALPDDRALPGCARAPHAPLRRGHRPRAPVHARGAGAMVHRPLRARVPPL